MFRTSRAGRIENLIVFRAAGDGYVPIGELRFEGSDKRFGSFHYGASHLAAQDRRAIDPIGLPIRRKWFNATPEEVHPAFHDVGPDGWGKSILDQAFPMRRLGMAEYLALGGTDRTGDLAFGFDAAAPATWKPEEGPLIDLPSDEDDLEALLVAAEAAERGEATATHLQILMRDSRHVGGARPKTRLRHDGRQWIAKFQAAGDLFDNPRVEAVSLDVAEAAGLAVPDRRVLEVAGRSVLLVERFDRSPAGRPYGYLSAGTLLGEPSFGYGTRRTYTDIAAVAERIGVAEPFPEVFRRLLVNAHLHNTDDHLRNHAFIDKGAGWELSPIFDVVPNHRVLRHVLAPAPGVGPERNPETAYASYPRFGLSEGVASAIRDQVEEAVRRIPEFMDAREVKRAHRDLLAPFISLAGHATGFTPPTA